MDPVTEAGAVLRGRAAETREKIEDAVHSTRERLAVNVQAHPLRTILFAAGAGILVGMLLGLGRRRKPD